MIISKYTSRPQVERVKIRDIPIKFLECSTKNEKILDIFLTFVGNAFTKKKVMVKTTRLLLNFWVWRSYNSILVIFTKLRSYQGDYGEFWDECHSKRSYEYVRRKRQYCVVPIGHLWCIIYWHFFHCFQFCLLLNYFMLLFFWVWNWKWSFLVQSWIYQYLTNTNFPPLLPKLLLNSLAFIMKCFINLPPPHKNDNVQIKEWMLTFFDLSREL